ncbi:hypothetical protein [Halpernia frigidisoli]|uniref:Uncharacterized protein n=1 Tax=Halpernia frigidisoli TaxID=1125876 RepID=A0A1I3EGF3_9FLAO|nr:hypothetical protein [Halpernia frigidisoli]SFH98027.1 hypothetical protein SAMN05443292_1066 [Halpernia frigidisoli]
MDKDKFQNISDDVLLKEQKKLKNLNKIYGIVLLLLLVSSIYLGLKKGNFTMIAVCLGLFSIFVVNFQSLRDFKKEVEKRNLGS